MALLLLYRREKIMLQSAGLITVEESRSIRELVQVIDRFGPLSNQRSDGSAI